MVGEITPGVGSIVELHNDSFFDMRIPLPICSFLNA